MNENNTTPLFNQPLNWQLSGGLNLGRVTLVHELDTKSTVRAAFFILLLWFGFAVALEFIKYLMAK